jgi:hypothetical protein
MRLSMAGCSEEKLWAYSFRMMAAAQSCLSRARRRPNVAGAECLDEASKEKCFA